MKTKILKMLMDKKEQYISGEEMCNILGVTRTAVWKHINSLKEEGYTIESSPKKGYRLTHCPDLLRKEEMEPLLQNKLIGKAIKSYESIDSTNIRAKELAVTGAQEGTVVISERQTLGKGRMGRSWVSTEGKGIWMSIILRPVISPVDASKITQLAALAVAQGIQDYTNIKPLIKWPNDIVMEGKKVCGILTEMGAEIDRIDYIILGIGINANQEQKDFPEDIAYKASSIKLITNQQVARKQLLKHILERLEQLYFQFVEGASLDRMLDLLNSYSATVGKEVKIIQGERSQVGKAMAIDRDGSLVVTFNDGQTKAIISGEVSVRGMEGYV